MRERLKRDAVQRLNQVLVEEAQSFAVDWTSPCLYERTWDWRIVL